MNQVRMLSRLVKSFGVSGYEWIEQGIAPTIQSIIGRNSMRIGDNLVFVFGTGAKKIMVSAHMDEVGFMVTKKRREYCRLVPIGSVNIKSMKNEQLTFLPSSVTSRKIEKAKDFSDLKIYFKSSPEIGDVGTFSKQITVNNNIVESPCLDNRVGCCALIQCIRQIAKINIKNKTVFFCFAPREEQRANGIMPAVKKINPDICIDVDSAYAQPIKKQKERKNWRIPVIGKGPAIQLLGKDYILTYDNRKKVTEICKKFSIAFQYEVPDRDNGGTFAQTLINNGYETIQINIPVALQHCSKSRSCLGDITATSVLLKEVILNI